MSLSKWLGCFMTKLALASRLVVNQDSQLASYPQLVLMSLMTNFSMHQNYVSHIYLMSWWCVVLCHALQNPLSCTFYHGSIYHNSLQHMHSIASPTLVFESLKACFSKLDIHIRYQQAPNTIYGSPPSHHPMG